MTLSELQASLDTGTFHHATYRDIGTLWEGLQIYLKEDNGFNGFTAGGCFPKNSADLQSAQSMLRHRRIGTSIGAFGEG